MRVRLVVLGVILGPGSEINAIGFVLHGDIISGAIL